jgi:ABC-type hemin transport system substrate-binding protein
VIFCAVLALLSLPCCTAQTESDARSADEIRLAVLSPALADTLHALGHGGLIVGRQQYDRFTDPDVPVVGDLTGIDYESMIRASPTHIVAQMTEAGLPDRLMRMAAERGWEIVELPLLTLDDVLASISALDQLTGGSDRAESLIGEFEVMLGRDLPLGRTVVVASSRPLAVIGPGAFHWELIQRIGGVPVPVSGAAYLTLDAESLGGLAAETIVVLAPGGSDSMEAAEALGAAAGLAMPALENGRLIVVTDPRCMLPSVSLLRVVEQIHDGFESFDSGSGR